MNNYLESLQNSNSVFQNKETKILDLISRWFLIVCCIFAFCTLFISTVYEKAPVSGPSMQNTFNKYGDGLKDTVIINVFMKYSYGDIIVIDRSKDTNVQNFHIKRVVGLPGDKINFVETNGRYMLQRNGKLIQENYVKSQGAIKSTYDNFHDSLTLKEDHQKYFDNDGNYVVPKNSVFVLGDNRGVSEDSSINGAYSMDTVVGYVQYVVPSGVSVFGYFIQNIFRLPLENAKLYSNV